MFTAKNFLENPSRLGKYRDLGQQLRSEPDRLRGEFFAIATNPNERSQTRALMILGDYSKELGTFGSSEVTDGLIAVFEKEYPPGRLDDIAAGMRIDGFHPGAWVAYLFCLTFAKLAPDRARTHIDAVQKAFNGTDLEAGLIRQLDII